MGYQTGDGTRLLGPLPPSCLDERGDFPWWDDAVQEDQKCAPYLETTAALFRVDVPIVGPVAEEIAAYEMTWGDGDCNIDFVVGQKWLVAGFYFTQELREPIRPDEIAALQRMAARPAFDFAQLY